jgi:transcriptional regulator with XRE-family HTH domain
MAFADMLKKLRKDAGLTQQQLADKAHMFREAIARFETGSQGPSWESVQILARALGVDITAFQEAMPDKPKKPRKAKKD